MAFSLALEDCDRGIRYPHISFVLVMESLHLLIKHKVQTDGNFQHHWRCKELGIINLCFADDLLLFFKADIHSATVLHDILQNFGVLSGLHANAQKSQVIFSKSATQVQHQIQSIFGFPQGTLPVRYLGVPLITSKLSLADCAPLILKIEARIAGWNQLKLTYAGRTQLIKSVLSSIHQYWCSVFILPKGVIKTIDAKLRNFLWRGGTESGGYKVAWEQVGDGTDFKLWLDPWHPDGTLIHRYPHGPLVTGLSLDSPLSTVIVDGQWNWPSEYHIDINEIITKLPLFMVALLIIFYGKAARERTPRKMLTRYSRILAARWNGHLYFMAPSTHPDTSSSFGLQFWNGCQPLTNHGAIPQTKAVYCVMELK
ncbi:UNVERIFIED_CONTAM: hypothetical protein Sangu_3245300 [Sesamum angustifolium]|uniref:Reverse transcriptase domain-containing protein n=1 Tax=Sesamum angustifolium TaxID=2727405 RepID=A0AAW2JFV9_9LAMI